MAGIAIPLLTSATTPLDGTELIIVEQGGVTKKSTITAGQQLALDAASTAQSTAESAASMASQAASDASTALSTANSKLSTVSVDGVTITGNGTSGNPLVANVPTLYEQITKVAFAALVVGNNLVVGKSYLVEDAYLSSVYGSSLYVLVTAISNNDISQLSWVKWFYANSQYNNFVKCRTDISFSFLTFYETSVFMYLNQSQCQSIFGTDEFVSGCNLYVSIGGKLCKTSMGDSSNNIVTKNVVSLTDNGILGEIDINANTFKPYTTSSYKSYVAMITQAGTNAPVATVMKNELSGAIVFTRSGGGVYIGTLAGAFTQNKTYATISQTSYQATAIIGFYFPNEDIFQISVLTIVPAGIDSEINQAMLEIRVYN